MVFNIWQLNVQSKVFEIWNTADDFLSGKVVDMLAVLLPFNDTLIHYPQLTHLWHILINICYLRWAWSSTQSHWPHSLVYYFLLHGYPQVLTWDEFNCVGMMLDLPCKLKSFLWITSLCKHHLISMWMIHLGVLRKLPGDSPAFSLSTDAIFDYSSSNMSGPHSSSLRPGWNKDKSHRNAPLD